MPLPVFAAAAMQLGKTMFADMVGGEGLAAAGKTLGDATKVLSGDLGGLDAKSTNMLGGEKENQQAAGQAATAGHHGAQADIAHAISLRNIQQIQRGGGQPVPMGGQNLPGQGIYPSGLQPRFEDLNRELKSITSEGLKGGLAGMVKIFPKVAQSVERFGTQVVEASRHLAMFSPQITYAVAQMDRQRMVHQMDLAQSTGGSNAFATKRLMSLRDDLQPLEKLGTNIKNIGSGVGMFFAKIVSWPVGKVATFLNKIAEWLGNLLGGAEEEKTPPFENFINQVLDDRWLAGPKSRRPGEK